MEKKNRLERIKDALNELGYESSIVFENPSYDTAIIGISSDGQVVYDYDKMVEYLVKTDEMTPEEACEFIDYNTIRALPYAGSLTGTGQDNAPIIMMNYGYMWDDDDDEECQD